ncbi:hypothetical protein AURDEDRAFT_187540 [Auricularia subglabra TFB-10046 SS5]|uniref:MYND-type domain-containing protein n=1 Tax=Auricularia subglabra (strain TFB-10046 / SS5) TaxID=717982 RepID=J0D173_AURST|nr:hypothetical protein AURDEDRAFT_187540 [Auricularia subglabra TFB-10046 SS5]
MQRVVICKPATRKMHIANGYGLSVYELALLNEAGVPPWYGAVKHILKVVNGIKVDAPSQKSREHHATTQCHNCWAPKSEAKLFLCAQCKAAKYCSKECQKAAWTEHKVHCKVAAASREQIDTSTKKIQPFGHVPDLPTSPSELASILQGWTNKHRPLLARSLVHALDLHRDPKAHITKALFVMVDWVSLEKPTAQRFKVVSAVVQEFTSIPGCAGGGIADTRRNLDAVQRGKGGYGVAMMIIMCVSCTPPALNVAPVYLHKGVDKEPVDARWLDVLTAKLG